MALGFGSLGKKPSKAAKSNKSAKLAEPKGNSDADDILKKMDEKAASGDCPFC